MSQKYIKVTKDKLPELTKGLKKVANHLLMDPMIFAIHPAKKVGEMIGVSETMVIRFCYQVGYSGFSVLQKEVRQHLLNLSQETPKEVKPGISKITESMTEDITHLNMNIQKLDIKSTNEAIDLIIDSEKVLIVGYYHSFTFAHWLSFNLNYVLGNALLYRPEDDAGLLDLLPKKACVVIFSFFRYALDTIRIAEEAKKKGVKVITITDSWASPVAEHADVVISLSISESKNLISKGPVTLSFVNGLLSEIINRKESRGKIQSTKKFFIKDGEE